MKFLASAFAIGVGTTSKIADRLEKEGWMERRPNPANRLVPSRSDFGRRVGLAADRARLAGGDPGDPRRGTEGPITSPRRAALGL